MESGTSARISHDIYIDSWIAFREGEIVTVECVSPNEMRSDYKYVVTSTSLGKRFQLSDADIAPMRYPSQSAPVPTRKKHFLAITIVSLFLVCAAVAVILFFTLRGSGIHTAVIKAKSTKVFSQPQETGKVVAQLEAGVNVLVVGETESAGKKYSKVVVSSDVVEGAPALMKNAWVLSEDLKVDKTSCTRSVSEQEYKAECQKQISASLSSMNEALAKPDKILAELQSKIEVSGEPDYDSIIKAMDVTINTYNAAIPDIGKQIEAAKKARKYVALMAPPAKLLNFHAGTIDFFDDVIHDLTYTKDAYALATAVIPIKFIVCAYVPLAMLGMQMQTAFNGQAAGSDISNSLKLIGYARESMARCSNSIKSYKFSIDMKPVADLLVQVITASDNYLAEIEASLKAGNTGSLGSIGEDSFDPYQDKISQCEKSLQSPEDLLKGTIGKGTRLLADLQYQSSAPAAKQGDGTGSSSTGPGAPPPSTATTPPSTNQAKDVAGEYVLPYLNPDGTQAGSDWIMLNADGTCEWHEGSTNGTYIVEGGTVHMSWDNGVSEDFTLQGKDLVNERGKWAKR